jgi:hypothetical protein
MKTFTLDEAQSLLPVLEALLARAVEAKRAAEAIESELHALKVRIFQAGGTWVNVVHVAAQRTALEAHVDKAKEVIAEIDAIGVQVKDLDVGLLDFPCRLDDEIVLLCWKAGESRIEHWHTMESGFQGRQPIDERFRRSGREKPN